MATDTWTGAISTDYGDFHNWGAGLVPDSSDTAIFGTATRTAVTIAAGGVGAWLFTGASYTIAINTSGAIFDFSGAGVQATGGSATIELFPSSLVRFFGVSDGGTAAYVLDPDSTLEFLGAGPNGDNIVHLGSLAGDSTSTLGLVSGERLLVGGNNRSTTFAGGIVIGPGAALVKVGTAR
jgi:hypothetical protein